MAVAVFVAVGAMPARAQSAEAGGLPTPGKPSSNRVLGSPTLATKSQNAGSSTSLRFAQNDSKDGARSIAGQPPRVIQAHRFLAERGWTPGRGKAWSGAGRPGWRTKGGWRKNEVAPQGGTAATATWQALGPEAVLTPNYGLVTGRVSALAVDPTDSTGNHLYLGTTGGGVWVAQNAATSNASSIVFAPLTDTVAALSGAMDASISIGALTVQPGGTGVILAGTGDPNDALDSYYGAGILRSADGGNSWSLTQTTADMEWGFAGEGFAGFAWSTVNPQLVVAAVSQAYEGTLVNADRPNESYEGLYYSLDSGATWNLATITDGAGADVQGPNDPFAGPDGNAATSVVWNPVRQLFVAAVRFHGYYQSTDGVTWTRMAAQPGSGLSTLFCPTNHGAIGSIDCPIFRGTLAVNPQTGDTFAWTVDIDNQDQGLWQDQCAASGGACANQSIAFGKQWNTTALETSTIDGAATIANGEYNLALAAVPSQQDTVLLAGANDLWKCSLAMGCVWRNTTNASTCMSAQVASYQHALAWSAANPLEIFVGNDSGLWRSMDAIGETGPVCAAADATHFQNLNGSLGSLAEVVSMSQASSTPYTMMAGLGVNGTAGVKNATGPTAEWPQILGGDGGPVAVDPSNADNWYVNNEEGVSIYLCADASPCTPATFGASPVITDADVGGDGYTMTTPAPFLVDPLDTTQLLIGTCRVWRGPADGVGWSGGNAISPILDSLTAPGPCSGDALIRSVAAMELAGGSEVVYVGMYGSLNGGANLPGHVLSATINPASSSPPVWRDLTLNPVTNDSNTMNLYGLDISSLFIDPHDTTGNTVYATVEGIASLQEKVKVAYRSTDGGAHWATVISNLPWAPASSLVVDPQDANTVYIATDAGVYFTTGIAACMNTPSTCWSAFGTGLPEAPVVGLSASASAQALVAATYGRGVWQTPLWTAGTGLTTAAANPASLTFASQVFETPSKAQTVTLENTGSLALTPTAIDLSGDFSETDECQNTTVAAGKSCPIEVTFTPTGTGSRTGQMIIYANISGGQLSVELSGTGTPAGAVSLTPATINFDQALGGPTEVGTTSAALQVEAANNSGTPVPITGISISLPFTIASNACGTSTLAAETDCQVMVAFAPTQAGAVAGTLTFTDGAGTQTVTLTGTGAAPPTDTLGVTSLTFPGTVMGQLSAAQTVSLTNTGDLPLTSIAISASEAFQTSNNCGTQLIGRASCAISVIFAPTQVSVQTGTLTVSDALRTQTVALTGTGLQPAALSVSPPSLDFAAVVPGQSSAAQTITISNGGSAAASSLALSTAPPFSLTQNTCSASLAAGASCTAGIVFQPAVYGSFTGTLTINSATAPGPVTVALSGSGFDFTLAASGSTTQTVASGQTAYYTLAITLQSGSPGEKFTFQSGTLPTNALCLFNPTSETVSAGATGNVTVEISTGQSGSSARSTGPV
ncbi:MAG: choice-of-anchor D domain-containing protein, partial [Terracidiphilus sp.]